MPRLLVSLLTAVALLAACANSVTDPDADPGPAPGPDPDPGPPVELTCQGLGFACRPADVSPAVMQRSDELLEQAVQRFTSGQTIAQVADWLDDQTGMRLVLTGDYSVMFILTGGMPVVVHDAIAATGRGSAVSAVVPEVSTVAIPDVVGIGTPREKPDRKKKALVLSPFEFEYQTPDPGRDVQEILGAIDDYAHADGVQYFENEEVGANVFFNWGDYDVVLLNTHGGTLSGTDTQTGQAVTTTFLVTGTELTSCAAANTGTYALMTGVSCVAVNVRFRNVFVAADEFRNYLTIWPNFFTTYSSLGPNKAVVVLNACMSAVSDALPLRLAGSTSAVFGWTDDVRLSFSSAAIPRLFVNLATGLPSQGAFDKACAGGSCIDVGGKGAQFKRFANGPDLRIRDLASVISPLTRSASASDARVGFDDGPTVRLATGSTIPFLGQSQDGISDELLLIIEVEGVEAGRESGHSIRVFVDEVERGDWSLASSTAARVDEYTVRIRQKVPLDFDVQRNQTIDLRIEVDLPEGGKSETRLSLVLANPVLEIESRIETGEPGDETRVVSEVAGTIDLFLKENAADEKLEFEKGRGDLKYVSFKFEGNQDACTVSSITYDGTMKIEGGEISFADPDARGFGVPEELVLMVQDIREQLIFECAGFTFTLPFIHWFAGFVSFHSGALGGENELDEVRGGLVIRDWTEGTGDVYARKTYDRVGTEEETVFRERTTLEVKGPRYP